jgi:mannose-6-phosphate isomerase-like protein (cupin superfamily)
MTDTITLIRSHEAPRFDIGGVEFLAGAAPSRASSQLCTWTIVVAAGHDSEQAHTLDRDEVFTVVDGSIRLAEPGEILRPGDTAVVPAGTPIRLSNPAPEPARVQVAITAGFSAVMEDGTVVGTPPWAQ